MIKEDYVSFETAKLLKEKGFDKYPIFPCYKEDNSKLFIDIPTTLDTINYCFIPAPTLQMAMKWLREEKKIGIEVNINFDCAAGKWYYEYGFCIFQLSGTFEKLAERDYDGYKTYEEACEAAIKYCLENLI